MNFLVYLTFIIYVILSLTTNVIYGKIPDYIKVCEALNPNINQCIKNSVEELRPKLLVGIPELEVPPIEPMKIPKISLIRGPKNANINAELYQLKVWGPANFIITDLKSDIRNYQFDFELLLPKLYFEGKYKMNTRVLLLSLHGSGDVNGTFTNYKSNVSMKGTPVEKDGNEYIQFDRLKLNLSVGKAQIHFTNLFNGDPTLGAIVNRIINDNSKAFIEEISPTLEQSIAQVFTDIANKITLKFNAKELFP